MFDPAIFGKARTRFGGLSGAVKGALLMTAAAACFAAMNVVIRAMNQELHPFQVAFLRCATGCAFMLPWLARTGFEGLRTASHKLYFSRAFVGYGSMLCWFTAIASLPIAEATALSFTSPLFATAAAALLLGEVVRQRRWTATIVGFLGAMVVLRPGLDVVSFAHLLVLASAALGGWNSITVKQLTRTDNPNAIILYMTLYLVPMSAIPASFVWQWPSAQAWVLTFFLGLFATLAHQSFTRALAKVMTGSRRRRQSLLPSFLRTARRLLRLSSTSSIRSPARRSTPMVSATRAATASVLRILPRTSMREIRSSMRGRCTRSEFTRPSRTST